MQLVGWRTHRRAASAALAQARGPLRAGRTRRRSPSPRPARWPRRAPRSGPCVTSMPPSTSMSSASALRVDLAARAHDLGHHVAHEGLAAETGEDRHQQQQVDVAEERRDLLRRACRDWRPVRRAGPGRARRRSATRCAPTSTWTVQPSAPALLERPRGSDRVRSSSGGSRRNERCSGAATRTTGGPIDTLGTKCPSMTSTWSQSVSASISSHRVGQRAEVRREDRGGNAKGAGGSGVDQCHELSLGRGLVDHAHRASSASRRAPSHHAAARHGPRALGLHLVRGRRPVSAPSDEHHRLAA